MAAIRGKEWIVALVGIVVAAFVIWVVANAVSGDDSDNGGGTAVAKEGSTGVEGIGVVPEAPDNTRDQTMSRETCNADSSISWTEAAEHAGREVTLVRGGRRSDTVRESGHVADWLHGARRGAAALPRSSRTLRFVSEAPSRWTATRHG